METPEMFKRQCGEHGCAGEAFWEFWAVRTPESVPLCTDHTLARRSRATDIALASGATISRGLQMPVCDDRNCGRESTFCLAPISTTYWHPGGASACTEHVAVMLLGYHDIGMDVTVSQYRFGRVFK